jgi:cytochrome b pre-mRNA-processing protein 3
MVAQWYVYLGSLTEKKLTRSEAGLKPTFSTWSQVTMLHMYLLSARFRSFPAGTAQPWQQHLLDHFFYDAENKMTIEHNMHARGTRNKYLKDIYLQWRGLLASYDYGLAKGDAVLATAIWRNVFKANEDVDIRALAQITSYVRKTLSHLDGLPDDKVVLADLEFGSPDVERGLVDQESQMMDLPFEREPGNDPKGKTEA